MADKDWKIMVYLSGDNDLGEAMVSSITGLSKIIDTTDRVAVYVYYDSNVPDFPSVEFTFGGKDGQRIRSLGSEIAVSDRSVYKFLQGCLNNEQPTAERHLLILSGHGDAYQGNNFLKDSGGDSSLSMVGLARVLRDVKKKYLGGKNFDIIGFDSCCMSSVEVAMQIDSYADHMIASQGLIPNDGWNYGGMIDRIVRSVRRKGSTDIDSAEMTKYIFDSLYDMYGSRCDFSGRSIDIAAIDLNKFSKGDKEGKTTGVPAALNSVARSLTSLIEERKHNLPFMNALLAAHYGTQSYLFDQCADVLDLADQLAKQLSAISSDDPAIVEVIAQLEVLKASVENCSRSEALGSEYQFSNGLSVYFPWSYLTYITVRRAYLGFDFAYEKRPPLPPEPTRRIKDPEPIVLPADGDWVRFLDNYLMATIRPDKESTAESRFVKDLKMSNAVNVGMEVLSTMKEGHPRTKYNDPNDRYNDPRDRYNDPNDKYNDPRDKLTAHKWETFRRMKNVPWRLISYEPTDTRMRQNRS